MHNNSTTGASNPRMDSRNIQFHVCNYLWVVTAYSPYTLMCIATLLERTGHETAYIIHLYENFIARIGFRNNLFFSCMSCGKATFLLESFQRSLKLSKAVLIPLISMRTVVIPPLTLETYKLIPWDPDSIHIFDCQFFLVFFSSVLLMVMSDDWWVKKDFATKNQFLLTTKNMNWAGFSMNEQKIYLHTVEVPYKYILLPTQSIIQ